MEAVETAAATASVTRIEVKKKSDTRQRYHMDKKATRSFVLENGGRKFWLVLIVIMFAFLSEAFALGISRETIRDCLIAAVGGSGAIALEDSLRVLFGQKKAVPIDDGEKAEE